MSITDGSSIEYEIHGDGFPLLLIPGMGFGRWGWFKQVPALSRRFRVITFDPRSPRDPEHGVADLARDAAALLDRLGVARAHVLGASLGGFVAQELALARPDLVERLVLVSTSYGGRGGEGMSYRALAAMFGLGSFTPQKAARRGLKVATSARYRAKHPQEFDRIVKTRLAFSPSLSSYLRQAKSGANFDASRRVQDIGAPTLVIHGSADRYVPVSNAYDLARAVPGAALRVLDGAGHLVFIERAEEVNAEVASFLLGIQEAHRVREARLRSAPERKPEGWLRRLPRAIGRLAKKLGDRLTR
ncbi:MAG: alpha/beta hydrolase [Actinomycetota bacterium]|nr:alpha/beta hydrolase [Actinomycetota bacterium]